jgi:glucokinase
VALGEQWRGAARDATHVVALTAGDCVHAGIVIDGRPFEGAHSLAGAAGWLALNPVEREDYRKIGCLEAEIGASGIVRRLIWRLKSGDMSRVLDRAGGNMSAITVGHIFDAARDGDGVAISVVRDTARYIGMAIGNLVAIVDPDVVVLGGVIAEAADLLVEPARTEATRRMPASVSSAVRIVAGQLGDEAGALGAARAAMLAR